MPNQLSNELKRQLFKQESEDPFLILFTIDHEDWDEPIRLVNNNENIISRGLTFYQFPVAVTLAADDGESVRDVTVMMDNVSLELIGKFRQVTRNIRVKLEMVLASIPNEVQIENDGLTFQSVNYNAKTITAKLIMDNFLNTPLTSERYTPKNFPGIF